jgi:hypothetical protein
MPLISYQSQRFEDLRDAVSKIAQEQNNNILQLFLVQDLAATDTVHKWVDKKLKGYKDYLQNDINTSVTTVTVSNGASKRVIANQTYLKIDDELLLVTDGAGTDTLTVVRARLGSAATIHTAGSEVFFMEHVHAEGADNTRDDSQTGIKTFNYCQIFRRELKLSGTSQAVNSVGGDNKFENQVAELLPELMGELRLAALQGVRYANADESIRTLGGLFHYVSTISDEGGNAINTDMLDEKIITLLDNGANPNDLVILAPSRQIKRINSLKVARVMGGGMNTDDNTLRSNIDRYEFSDALVRIVRVPELARNELYIGERNKMKIVPLQNRGFKVQDIGQVGDSVQKLLVGEYTTEVLNASDSWIRVKNLAV